MKSNAYQWTAQKIEFFWFAFHRLFRWKHTYVDSLTNFRVVCRVCDVNINSGSQQDFVPYCYEADPGPWDKHPMIYFRSEKNTTQAAGGIHHPNHSCAKFVWDSWKNLWPWWAPVWGIRLWSWCRDVEGNTSAMMWTRCDVILLSTKGEFGQSLHPGRLTWNLQITHLERKIIFQTSMIMFHVNLQECSGSATNDLPEMLRN